MASSNKNLNETSQNQSRRMRQQTSLDLLLFNLWRRYASQILSFPHKKVISTRACPKTVKKTRNDNLLVEVDSQGQAENIKNKKVPYDQNVPA